MDLYESEGKYIGMVSFDQRRTGRQERVERKNRPDQYHYDRTLEETA